jgi:hypothetical protein
MDEEQVRAMLLADYAVLGSWQKVGDLYGVHKATAFRLAKRGYWPKDLDIVARLMGIRSGVVIQKVVRGKDGRFQSAFDRRTVDTSL